MNEKTEEFEMTVVEARNSVIDSGVIMDPQDLMRQAANRFETIDLNIIESEDIHVGPVISIADNVQNIEVAKGCILGAEQVTRPRRGIRCSIVVFLCWAVVITVILIFFIFYFALANTPNRMNIELDEPWYLIRDHWFANPAKGIELLNLPVSLVIIGHSALESCTEKFDCIEKVQYIQTTHQLDRRWEDIGPNFLAGGDGYVFEGRGANVLGSMVTYFNLKSISIMFLGNYVYDKPILATFDNLNVFLKQLVNKQVLTADYKLYGQCQLIGSIVPPGPNLMDKLYLLDHWDPSNKTKCHPK